MPRPRYIPIREVAVTSAGPSPRVLPIPADGGKPIDKFAASRAAETIAMPSGHYLQSLCTRPPDVNPTKLNASQEAALYRVARAAPRCRVVRPSWRASAQSR